MKLARWPARSRLTGLFIVARFAMSVGLLVVMFVLASMSPVRLSDRRESALADAIDTYRDDVQDRLLLWSLVALTIALVLAIGLGWMVNGHRAAAAEAGQPTPYGR